MINFQKEQLSNLGFSLEREILLANNNGAYCSTTLAYCNTRKYHGLLIVPQPELYNFGNGGGGDNRYVLLSGLDETISRKEQKLPAGMNPSGWHLSTHRYPNIYFPQGYKHIENFSYQRTPEWTLKADDIEISKEILLMKDEDRILIRYTVTSAEAPFEFRFDPFLAFRNIHTLGRVNMDINKKSEKVDNGISYTPNPQMGAKGYEFTNLFMQFSRKPEFVAAPDWYYNVEYTREQERGYDYSEDLYTPGYFKLKVKKGDSIIFSAGTTEVNTRRLNHLFERELKSRILLNTFNDALENAAGQFIVKEADSADNYLVMAGYPWFGPWGRDTFISLPGLTLSPNPQMGDKGGPELCKEILDSYLRLLKNGLLPNVGTGEKAAYNSADASLWFIWALQKYVQQTGTISLAWEEYGDALKSILENYRKGTLYNIHTEDNGLLYAGEPGVAVTWMDAVVNDNPVTPRTGFAVELNALWYNAICFTMECAKHGGDRTFANEWYSLSEQIKVSFNETFWDEEKGYLADCVNGSHHDWSVRPNQVFAASLPFSPISNEIKKSLLKVVKDTLLTPRGLRTLSPEDANYKGVYYGNHAMRDRAYHQGTVWPWLLGHFTEACLKTDPDYYKEELLLVYENFAPAISEYGIGTIAEIYDGDAPNAPKGAIAQAWSVAELLRMRDMLKPYSGNIGLQPIEQGKLLQPNLEERKEELITA